MTHDSTPTDFQPDSPTDSQTEATAPDGAAPGAIAGNATGDTPDGTAGDASGDGASNEVEIETEANARQRRITARLAIACQPEPLWQVLTAYEQLPEFLPNLVESRRLEHPEGGIRLEQVGAQRLMKVNFRARVVLDLEEVYPERIHFQMVEGDFRQFHGFWALECPEPAMPAPTRLTYCVTVLPPRAIPARLIEQRLRQDLSANLLAIRQRVCGGTVTEA